MLHWPPDWLPVALAAPFIGSFLATVVQRLPEGRSVLLGRSQCPQCRHRLRPLDLVPILSWILLRGRCRHCDAPITATYPAIESAAAAVALWAATVASGTTLLIGCIFGWTLLALAIIDWRSYELPDALTAALLAFGIVAALAERPIHIADHVIGAVSGFAVFAVIAIFYRRWRRRDGLGWGDAKLLGGLGCWTGWAALPSIVFLAAATALALVVGLRLVGKRVSLGDRVPFGPFLAFAGWIVWLYGPLVVVVP
jgi:leader peptidase (prepilin peptidase) / N-methyltransferase